MGIYTHYYGKRLADIIFCLIFIPLLLPVFVMVSMIQVFFHGKNIFFRQKRVGINQQAFYIIKFRSLKINTTQSLQFSANNLTPWGNFIRKSGLDELPQLLHVLKGEMSIVGPRPLPWQYLTNNQIPDLERQLVKPGITGLTQINGRNQLPWHDRFYYDHQYIKHLSLKSDLKIIAKTFMYMANFKKLFSDPAFGIHEPTAYYDQQKTSG